MENEERDEELIDPGQSELILSPVPLPLYSSGQETEKTNKKTKIFTSVQKCQPLKTNEELKSFTKIN